MRNLQLVATSWKFAAIRQLVTGGACAVFETTFGQAPRESLDQRDMRFAKCRRVPNHVVIVDRIGNIVAVERSDLQTHRDDQRLPATNLMRVDANVRRHADVVDIDFLPHPLGEA